MPNGIHTSLPPGKFFPLFCCLPIFFQNQLFRKILSGIPSECRTDWIQIRPDILSGLNWVQSVCKGYEQTTLGGIELNKPKQHVVGLGVNSSTSILCACKQ